MKSLAIALSDPTWDYDVFRLWNLKPAPCQTTCSGAVDANGQPISLKQWYDAQAAAHPELVKREVYGTSVLGQELVAYRVTAGANASADGSKPGVMFNATQHAREWISTEVVRREFQSDVQEVLTRNLPFALDLAKSAPHPDQPVSHLGNTVPDFAVSKFATCYGDPQTVEVNARRALSDVLVNYQVDGGAVRQAATSEFNGGERCGKTGGYDHRLRGAITGFSPGQSVKVWFTAAGGKVWDAFTFTASPNAHGNSVLVLSAENQPTPAYLSYYTTALADAGIPADVYDVDANGRREADPLGVLEHFKAVVWYTGDNDYVRDLQPAGPLSGRGPVPHEHDERDRCPGRPGLQLRGGLE